MIVVTRSACHRQGYTLTVWALKRFLTSLFTVDCRQQLLSDKCTVYFFPVSPWLFAVFVICTEFFLFFFPVFAHRWRCKPQPPHLWATLPYPRTPRPSQSPKNKYSSRVSVVERLIWLHVFNLVSIKKKYLRQRLIKVNSAQSNQLDFQSGCSDRLFCIWVILLLSYCNLPQGTLW